MIRDSSMVEQEAVNFKVLGSNPSRGALKSHPTCGGFFVAVVFEPGWFGAAFGA